MAFLNKIGKISLARGIKRAKPKIKRVGKGFIRHYAPTLAIAGGAGLVASKTGSFIHKAHQVYTTGELANTIYQLIKKAYSYDSFYYAPWKIKARILARMMIRNPAIVTSLTHPLLSQAIYEILKRTRNKEGNKKLAEDIAREIETAL